MQIGEKWCVGNTNSLKIYNSIQKLILIYYEFKTKQNTGNRIIDFMDLAENVIPSAGDKGCMGEDEAFENLTDGEMEELNGSQEVVLETVEEESRPTEVEEKELQVGEEEKKKGARKILKHTMAAGASKKKFVQALLSQNKNTQARQGKRQGDGSKLQKEKGSSYPKQTSSKNSTASHG